VDKQYGTEKNYNGSKVASGVYIVLVRDESGVEKTVAKIVFVAKNK
jgi:hypothetical protein